jgi:SAM-dependent methyltransferase
MADVAYMSETWRNTRVVDDVAPLDYGATRAFFDGRAARADELDRRTITMYQDERAHLAEQRDTCEVEAVRPLLRTNPLSTRVFDIGCGVGRWGRHLASRVRTYTGVDFSEGLVELANQDLSGLYADGAAQALAMSATDIAAGGFRDGSFDLVILSGIMAYLNDEDCTDLLDVVGRLTAENAQIYVREPMARHQRLTLRQHWSEELAAKYSAVYRSVEKYAELVDEHLTCLGFRTAHSFELSPDLSNRAETGQFVMILDRRSTVR